MTDRPAISSDAFVEHLEHASKVVSTWPKWKQEILGGTATMCKTIEEYNEDNGPGKHPTTYATDARDARDLVSVDIKLYELEKRVVVLEKELKLAKYGGRHRPHCPSMRGMDSECTCGFIEAQKGEML